MKLISFLRWKFSKWTTSDILYWVGLFLFLFGILTGNYVLALTGLVIWAAGLMVLFVWAQLKSEYQRFLDEQSSLLTTIKDSDK